MPEHYIPRATLHEDLLRLYREDHEEVAYIDPVPDDLDRVHVITRSRGGILVAGRLLSDADKAALKAAWMAASNRNAPLEILP